MSRSLVYVCCSESEEIRVLAIDAAGQVQQIQAIALPERDRPASAQPLAISPDRRWLYAALRDPAEVATYAIDPATGALSLAATAPLAASVAYLTVDHSGRYLLTASYHEDCISVNLIADDGVARAPQQTLPAPAKPHSIVAARSNAYVAYACLGADVLRVQRFDDRVGRIYETPQVVHARPGSGPRHFAFSADSRFVYLLGELDGSLVVYAFDEASGSVGPAIQTASVLPPDMQGRAWAADLHATPDGRFLYASERTSSTLAAFQIDPARGTLRTIGSYPTAMQPRSFAIEPGGRLLLAAGQRSHSLVVHRIAPDTGELSTSDEVAVGNNPNWIEIVGVR